MSGPTEESDPRWDEHSCSSGDVWFTALGAKNKADAPLDARHEADARIG